MYKNTNRVWLLGVITIVLLTIASVTNSLLFITGHEEVHDFQRSCSYTMGRLHSSVNNESLTSAVQYPIEDFVLDIGDTVLVFGSEHSDIVIRTISEFANAVAEKNGYSYCEVIELCPDEALSTGAVHMVFDNDRYICVWVDNDREPLVLYDCRLTQSLIDNWEYN